MAEVIRPDELRKAAQAKEMERARQIIEADQRHADERRQLQEAFMTRQIQADAKERLHKALLVAAERGETHLQVFIFPSELCTDGGRAINKTRTGPRHWSATPSAPTNSTGQSFSHRAIGCARRSSIFRAACREI
jgi:hypothetical protein